MFKSFFEKRKKAKIAKRQLEQKRSEAWRKKFQKMKEQFSVMEKEKDEKTRN